MEPSNTMQATNVIVQVVIAIFTTIMAVASILAVFATNRNIRSSQLQTKGSLFLECLQKYIDIMRHRTQALLSKNKMMCEDHYREMIDLLWFEFQLWKSDLIEDYYIFAWLDVRHRNFQTDKLEIRDATGNMIFEVQYETFWKNISESPYFPHRDNFIDFMNTVYGTGDLPPLTVPLLI